MSSRKKELNVQLNQLVDAVILGILLWLCYYVRACGFLKLEDLWEIPPFHEFYWMLAILMPFGPFLLELQGFYSHPLDKTVVQSIEQVVRAGFWLVLMFGVAAIFLRLTVPSRSVLLLFTMSSAVVLIAKDRLIAWNCIRRLKRGALGEPIIVAGEPDQIRMFRSSLSVIQKLETRIVKTVDLTEKDGIQKLVEALHEHSVGRVILAVGRLEINRIQEAVEACEREGVEAWLSADFIRTSVARPTYETFDRQPMLVFRATPEISWAFMLKNAIDRVGAFFLIILLSPLFLIAALMVKFCSPGPILFSQRRAGLYGKPFTMWKFRSMEVGAEKRRDELAHANEMSGPVFKVTNDPRVTPVGKFLRKTSMDELPQLWNVLRGEMSLVGPRPLPVYETDKFESLDHRRRLSMKPGLTCLWQVRGRNRVVNFEDWVKMDLEYIDNWSLTMDFYILLRTVPAVLLGMGAK
ncbi:MAG: hypothetical protein Fur0032_10520 [Terrimicrobiaceae bacterium]